MLKTLELPWLPRSLWPSAHLLLVNHWIWPPKKLFGLLLCCSLLGHLWTPVASVSIWMLETGIPSNQVVTRHFPAYSTLGCEWPGLCSQSGPEHLLNSPLQPSSSIERKTPGFWYHTSFPPFSCAVNGRILGRIVPWTCCQCHPQSGSPRALLKVQCSALTILKLVIFEEGVLHFHFVLCSALCSQVSTNSVCEVSGTPIHLSHLFFITSVFTLLM